MEVTVKNFDDLLPEIEQSIEQCSFMAIDCEYSGLNVTDDKDNYFETVEERYHVVRKSASQFLVVQFGLCPFFYNPETDEFTHKAYNFYTFPRQFGHNAPNIRFLCESSSLDFLASCGFDFNKLIYEGIPYLTFSNEQKMREDYEKRQAYLSSEENSAPLAVPESLKKFMEETVGRIKRFISSNLTEFSLENLTPFQRKLIFHNLKPKYSNVLYFETVVVKEDDESAESSSVSESEKSDSESTSILSSTRRSTVSAVNNSDLKGTANGNQKDGTSSKSPSTDVNKTQPNRDSRSRVLRVVKLTEEEQNTRNAEKLEIEMDMISKGVGFSKVIRKISQSGKVVVGHNMLLDVSHTIHQFVDDLPDNLADFKVLVQSTFPNLIDTKLMSATHPFRELISSTVLFELIKKVQGEPFSLPTIRKASDENTGYDLTDRKKHEAGFDAFITGASFIGLCQYLGTLQTPKKPRVFAESPLVMPFLNKLYMMRMLDITYLNISGTDLTPSRSHVFYVTCPKDASVKNIQQLFSPFGNVQIWWQNQTSLFISLNDKDQSSLVMRNIEFGSEYRIIPFEQYQKMQAEKKRPLLSESPDRSSGGDVLGKKITTKGGDKSPPYGGEQKKKRPKTETGGTKKTTTSPFDEPAAWN